MKVKAAVFRKVHEPLTIETVEMGVAPQGELKRALQDLKAKTATAPVN